MSQRIIFTWLIGENVFGAGNLSPSNQPPRPTQPGHPSVGRRNEYRQGVVMLRGWEVKAGMARVWWQVKLCDPLYNT